MKNHSTAKRKPETRVLTAHVSTELAEKVDQLAEQLERPRGWIVRQALQAWIDEEELRHQMTLEALAEADAGHGVPHDEVEKWIRSLGTDKPLPPPTR
ncbi:MAG: CopG family ribbon-helix-helix protein [Acidobacteriaceae bacterium]